jgi:hypothetical protein
MAIKFRTEKARELKKAYDNLCKEYQRETERCQQLFIKYCQMEGMYGKMAHSWLDDGQGMRGYHYEYPSEEIERQEMAERKQFLVDNNYKSDVDMCAEYNDRLKALNEAFHLEQYGMTVEQKELEKRIARQKKDIESLKKRLAREEEYLAELEAEAKK